MSGGGMELLAVTATLKFGGVMEAVLVCAVVLPFWALVAGCYELWERWK